MTRRSGEPAVRSARGAGSSEATSSGSGSSAPTSSAARSGLPTSRMAELSEAAFREHERHLFGLCYRLTGSAADAEDLVQSTFERALAKPPRDLDLPLRPWLVRVAMNLGRDHLRRRKRSPYIGTWLPAPIETAGEASPPSVEIALDSGEGESTEARYDLLESVSFAFLLALEALSPTQRAVLLLRDVFDYSVLETAHALGLSEANVKTTHHRARRAMEGYEAKRARPTAERQAEGMRVLAEFLGHLASQDVAAIESMLADDVRSLSDGAGEFHAALRPVHGRKKVGLLYRKLTARRGPPAFATVRTLNGLPALLARFDTGRRGEALDVMIQLELDSNGKIRDIYSVLATRKLSAIQADFVPTLSP